MSSQSYGCSSSHVLMWELNNKKVEHWRIDILNCGVGKESWESLGQQGDQTSKSKGNQSKYSLEGLKLKLKLQLFGHLMPRADSSEKTLMLRKTEDRRRREPQKMRWLDAITNSMEWVWANSGDGEGQGGLACCSPWGRKEWDTIERLNSNPKQEKSEKMSPSRGA